MISCLSEAIQGCSSRYPPSMVRICGKYQIAVLVSSVGQLLHLLVHMHIHYTLVGAPPEPCPRRGPVDQQGCLSSRHKARLWGSQTCSLRLIHSLDGGFVSHRRSDGSSERLKLQHSLVISDGNMPGAMLSRNCQRGSLGSVMDQEDSLLTCSHALSQPCAVTPGRGAS